MPNFLVLSAWYPHPLDRVNFEKVACCLVVHQAGYRIRAVPLSVLWHAVPATLGTTLPVIDHYMLRHHLRLIDRHWLGTRRFSLWVRVALRNLLAIATSTSKSHGGPRIPNRNSRLLALRDAMLGRLGKPGPNVERMTAGNL